MDASTATATDVLGRPTGPRRKYTIAEKRRIAEETLRSGASVAVVARRHAINANLVFGWRRLYQQGLLTETEPAKAPPLLPVKVVTPTVVPSERSKPAPSPAAPPISKSSSIEIEFTSGQKLRIHGRLDRVLLMRLVRVLSRR